MTAPGEVTFVQRALWGGMVVSAICALVVRALPLTGTVGQFIDSTDFLGHPGRARAV